MKSLADWQGMVRGSTRGLTDTQVVEVARRMLASEERGLDTCIWHEAAAVMGTPCYCQRCRPDIKRYV